MPPEENTFLSGLRLELPYLVDALGADHGLLHDPGQFLFLSDVIVDHLRSKATPPANFLVAGCDQGRDAYSLCITLLEIRRIHRTFDFTILGTDFLPSNLALAVRGIYPTQAISSLSDTLTGRYFLRSRDNDGNRVRLKPGVRARVSFRCQDIFESFGLREPMDVIVCRQVLHHFHPALAKAMAERLRQYLAPGGILVLGAPMPRVKGLRHLQSAIYQAT